MKKSQKNKSAIPAILICVFTFLTAVVNLVSKIYDRKQTICAIEENAEVKAIIKSKKTEEV